MFSGFSPGSNAPLPRGWRAQRAPALGPARARDRGLRCAPAVDAVAAPGEFPRDEVLRRVLLPAQGREAHEVLREPDLIGEPYADASGTQYGAMIRQPILVYEVEKADLTKANGRALSRDVVPIVFTADLFETGNDNDNRAAVAAVPLEDLDLVAIALHADRKTVDKVMKGMKLHP